MNLVDIGANLTHESFDHDRDAVLARARAAGVAQLVVTGASREGSPKALELARAHPGVLYATAGVHPHHAAEYTAEADAEMRALVVRPEVVAVGECGLDYFRDFSPRPAQRRAFERLRRALAAGAGDDQLRDTGRACPREHRVAVVVEGFVGEVGADVDEVHGRADSGQGRYVIVGARCFTITYIP